MAATLADLIAEVEDKLYGFGASKDKAGYLTSDVTAAATSLPVNDTSLFSQGFVEISSSAGYELVELESADDSSNSLKVFPFGRGSRGTAALAHTANSRVAVDPQFPRYAIKNAINETILALYPDLFAVAQDSSQTTDGIKLTYSLPTGAERLLALEAQSLDYSATDFWYKVDRFSVNKTAGTVTILEAIPVGVPLRFTYAKQLTALSATTDALTSTGLAESARDIVVLGAMYRMLTGLQTGRITLAAQFEQAMTPSTRQTPAQALQALTQQFLLRVQQEQRKLRDAYPPLIYKTIS